MQREGLELQRSHVRPGEPKPYAVVGVGKLWWRVPGGQWAVCPCRSDAKAVYEFDLFGQDALEIWATGKTVDEATR